jgi:hypothetical protein
MIVNISEPLNPVIISNYTDQVGTPCSISLMSIQLKQGPTVYVSWGKQNLLYYHVVIAD